MDEDVVSLVSRNKRLLREAEAQPFEERLKAQETKLLSARDIVNQEHPSWTMEIGDDHISIKSETTDLDGETHLDATRIEGGWRVNADDAKHGLNPEGLMFGNDKTYTDDDIEKVVTAFVNSWTNLLTNE